MSDPANPAQIQLHDVHFSYAGDSEVLAGVSLEIRAGEHVCILGGNGSGKSTTVQLMNALLIPTSGTVRVAGTDSAQPGGALRIRQHAAMVFQHPEDQMVTSIVADDVAFGPENLGVPSPEIAHRVDEALAAVGMTELAQADPSDLSGGQKQRVAIAGALAMRPDILLLDEPCAMLDAEGHRDIQKIIDRLHRRGITIVHVTHFMEDALRADRVIVMRRGRVALDGTPEEVFAQGEAIRQLRLELPFEIQLRDRLERGADGGVAGAGAVPADALLAAAVPGKAASAIVFEHVSYSYAAASSARKPRRRLFRRHAPQAGPLALDDVSFTVNPGTLVALVGQTGSGKSTSMELSCALKLPTAGTVRIAGIDTADLTRRRELRAHVGYVSQLPERQLFAETVFDDVAFGPRNLGLSDAEVRDRVVQALGAVGLVADDALLQHSPFALSGGQQRAVALAGIIAMRQPILLLDEPMAGLDPSGRGYVRKILLDLKRQGTTMLLVTHSMDDAAELADRIIALDHGHKVADGTPREVFAQELQRRAGDGAEGAGTGRGLLPGLPSALSYAQDLARIGMGAPLADEPLTLDALAASVEAADLSQEVLAHGAAR